MLLLSDMVNIYNDNLDIVGQPKTITRGKTEVTTRLLPMFYNSLKVHFEITIDKAGNFIKAKSLGKDGEIRPLPGTLESSARSNTIAPYILTDNLLYVAGDLINYIPDCLKIDKKTGKSSYDFYIEQLEKFSKSEYSCVEIQAIYTYINKKTLITDLFREKIFDSNDTLKKSVKSMVAFEVAGFDDIEENRTVIQAWQNYYGNFISNGDEDIDYVTGKLAPTVSNSHHPQKILNNGDQSKLISSNNANIFKGRFLGDSESLTISYETSQKAFLALRWIIARQGISIGTRKYVIYCRKDTVINPIEDTVANFLSTLDNVDSETIDDSIRVSSEFYRNLFNNFGNITSKSPIIMCTLDNIDCKGRTQIVDYRNIDANEYYTRLGEWYDSTNIAYSKSGLSNLYHLSKEAYVEGVDNTVIASQVTQLLWCILEKKKIPKSFLNQLVRKAMTDQLLNGGRLTTILNDCAAIVKAYYYGNEGSIMLDEENNDRSYLFGRLLATAHKAESDVTERKITNATRYMTRFSQRPASTWENIYLNLNKYLEMLSKENSNYAVRYEKVIIDISNKLSPGCMTDEALSPLFILGYQQQLGDFWTKKSNKTQEEK